ACERAAVRLSTAAVWPLRAKLRARLRPMTARPVTPICAELLIELAPHDLGNGAAGASVLPVGARQSCRDHPVVPHFRPHARVARHARSLIRTKVPGHSPADPANPRRTPVPVRRAGRRAPPSGGGVRAGGRHHPGARGACPRPPAHVPQHAPARHRPAHNWAKSPGHWSAPAADSRLVTPVRDRLCFALLTH